MINPKNNSIPLGGIVMIEKIEKEFGFIHGVFNGTGGRIKNHIPLIKLHLYNKLTHSVSVNRIQDTYSHEAFEMLGGSSIGSNKNLYRILERIGRNLPILHNRFQEFLQKHNLISNKQMIDFSSFYVEGNKSKLSAYGYSRDHRPDKEQITFGISTGINNIPTALTIQKGNVADKSHMNEILKVIQTVLPLNSLLIFDCGANTKAIKERILSMGHNYLTLKQKHAGPYKKHLQYFYEQRKLGKVVFTKRNGRDYYCVTTTEGKNNLYIFFCPQLLETQLNGAKRKFESNKKKGNKLIKKRKMQRLPSNYGWVEISASLQGTLTDVLNPYISGIEGFFILESSVSAEPEEILRLYKERDKAEKFIQGIKDGIELRPIRCWNKNAVLGMIFVCFLANFLINLTLYLSKNPLVKNVKLLKKYLINLTLTMLYPKNAFRLQVLSNVTDPIRSLFDDFLDNYGQKELDLRW